MQSLSKFAQGISKTMKRNMSIGFIILVVALLLWHLFGFTAVVSIDALSTAVPGDIVVFGQYEQDRNANNGAEGIRWMVLKTEEHRVLLVSEAILDVRPFHSSYTDITWENSDIRQWLNNTFYNSAFNGSEKEKILRTELSNIDYIKQKVVFDEDGKRYYTYSYGVHSRNGKYQETKRNSTEDYVFLLSYEEAQELNTFKPKITELAQYGGEFYQKSRPWILRSVILWDEYQMFGTDYGQYKRVFAAENDGLFDFIWYLNQNNTYVNVNSEGTGIRPAIWIKIK